MKTTLGDLELKLVLIKNDANQPSNCSVVFLRVRSDVSISLLIQHIFELRVDDSEDGADLSNGC